MATGPENKDDSKPVEGGLISDRIWKTVSNTVRSVGSDDRVKELIQNVVGEETIKAVVQNVVPKDAARYAAKTVDSVKDEVVTLIGKQVNDFLTRLDLGHELQKILTSLSLEVRAEVRFIPNDKRVVKPEIKTGVSLKWHDDEVPGAPEKEAKEPPQAKKPPKKTSSKRAKTTTRRTKTTAERSTASKSKPGQKPSSKKKAAQKRTVRQKKSD